MPMQTTVAVLSTHRHPRLRYTLAEIGRDLGQRWRLFTDESKWRQSTADARVSYGAQVTDARALHVFARDFLTGKAPLEDDLSVINNNGLPTFFNAAAGWPGDLTFDVFACIFYALSRYEEYGDVPKDSHGRYSATTSHAGRHGYLHLPIVRQWCGLLLERLVASNDNFPPSTAPAYYFQPSYDIDLLWAYRHRGLRGAASGVKDLLTGHAGRAARRLMGANEDDPYDTLLSLLDMHEEVARASTVHHQAGPPLDGRHAKSIITPKPRVFWLLTDRKDRRDINPYPIPEPQKEMMRAVAGRAEQGIHPGYLTYRDPEVLRRELDRFKAILGVTPTQSRQHFLRFSLPETYRNLHGVGVRSDHTMGYADAIGWRAGTNLPFNWYDLEREKATYFQIHPFAAMDVTLKDYLGLDPAAASAAVLELARPIRRLGGPFTLLWHNSSFSEAHGWAGWRLAYRQLVEELTSTPTT